MSGFMFDFSTDNANDDAGSHTKYNCEENVVPADVPICQFSFYDRDAFVAMAMPIIKKCRAIATTTSTTTSGMRAGSNNSEEAVDNNNNDNVNSTDSLEGFVETVLRPFHHANIDKQGGGGAPPQVSIFHRHPPKIDVLECVRGEGEDAKSNNGANKAQAKSNSASASPPSTSSDRRDIVQGAYYGGLKVWSCAPDVADVVTFGAPPPPPQQRCHSRSSSSDDDAVDCATEEANTKVASEDDTEATAPLPSLIDYFADEIRRILTRTLTTSQSSPAGVISIAELGCGQSLPTLAAVRRVITGVPPLLLPPLQQVQQRREPSSFVFFLHDYNKEVISEVSVPNVANCVLLAEDEREKKKTIEKLTNSTNNDCVSPKILFATGHGDWTSVSPLSFVIPPSALPSQTLSTSGRSSGHVDIIIAADVTFDMKAAERFLWMAARILRKPSPRSSDSEEKDEEEEGEDGGLALVGTKEYYFGTNGGLEEMKEVIRKDRLPLSLTVLGKKGVGTMVRVLVAIRRIA